MFGRGCFRKSVAVREQRDEVVLVKLAVRFKE
jgi:hypothetical protein